jgi:hypothetical protein
MEDAALSALNIKVVGSRTGIASMRADSQIRLTIRIESIFQIGPYGLLPPLPPP